MEKVPFKAITNAKYTLSVWYGIAIGYNRTTVVLCEGKYAQVVETFYLLCFKLSVHQMFRKQTLKLWQD